MTEPASDRRSDADETRQGKPRVLIHIPIVHSQADMGSYDEQVRNAYIQQRGARAWQDSRRAIALFWKALETKILSLDLDYARIRIYQDALPVCGCEADIVRDLAKTGAANYRILLKLMERGAVLEGTESPELLLREKDLLNAGESGSDSPRNAENREALHERAAELLRARDRFIADRIDETLAPGEIGVLFIGALHHVTDLLSESIKVVSLKEFETGLSRP